MNLTDYALLTGDDEALLLGLSSSTRDRVRKRRFDLDSVPNEKCNFYFRFEKHDIHRLVRALKLPRVVSGNRIAFTAIEGLCILLRRFSYPNRLDDISPMFHRRKDELSRIINTMLRLIIRKYGRLVTSLEQFWLREGFLGRYAETIRRKGSPLPNCWGFIDGTVRSMCKPSQLQKVVYNGHKRTHALKFQSVVTPNGLISNLYGPTAGSRHDCYLLSKSNILELSTNFQDQNATPVYLYGDGGYPLRPQLQRGFRRHRNATIQQLAFNKSMSSLRICVEWEFGKIARIFAFLDFRKNLKLYLQPVGTYYQVAAILSNCHTCLYGSQTSQYFELNPPTLEQYLSNNPNL